MHMPIDREVAKAPERVAAIDDYHSLCIGHSVMDEMRARPIIPFA